MKVTIIGGTGKFGQFFNTIFQENNIETALLGRKNYDTLGKEVSNSDIIMISVPSIAAEKNYSDLSKIVKKGQLIIDVSSVMSKNVNFQKKIKCDKVFIHPLFAPTLNDHKNAKYILVNIEKSSQNKNLKVFVDLLTKKGSVVRESTLENHEKIMAYIQALSHFNSILLAKTLSDAKISEQDIEDFTTTFFRLEFDAISRIFAQSSEIYAAIQFDNSIFEKVLSNYSKNFDEMQKIVREKDYNAYSKIFENVNSSLSKVLKNSFEESQNLIKTLPANKTKIGFLGPVGSYSEMAASFFSKSATLIPFETISETIRGVNSGVVDLAVVPIENSIQGSIAETVDGLYQYKLFIQESIVVPIKHCVAALSSDIKPEKVELVLSHPQALGQCSEFILKEYPNAKLVHTLSTAQAFKKISEESMLNAVAIGTENAATKYGLKILHHNIQNQENNETKFVVISKAFDVNSIGRKTSVVVCPKVDRPGLLVNILQHFTENGINLSKIESRPSKLKLGTYVFHIDIDGNYSSPNVKKAITGIQKESEVIFIGCYDQIKYN